MGVEPTAARAERPAADFEDREAHRDSYTPAKTIPQGQAVDQANSIEPLRCRGRREELERPFEKARNPTLNPSPQAGRDFKSGPFSLPRKRGKGGDGGKDTSQTASKRFLAFPLRSLCLGGESCSCPDYSSRSHCPDPSTRSSPARRVMPSASSRSRKSSA